MRRTLMADIKAGDEVRVFDVNGKRMGQPEGGWPGTVEKVGRKLVDIRYRGRVQSFRLDTRRSNDGYAHQSFKTPEQAAVDGRHARAADFLQECRISMPYTAYSAEQLEALADLVRSFGKGR
jgi:sulfite reductase beta subunit-like hemoprotein